MIVSATGAYAVSELLRTGARHLETGGILAGEARAEARLLLIHVLEISAEVLRLRPERAISGEEARAFEALIARRALREPLAYITGQRAFYGLRFRVSPAVLIPRPETEFLVEAALRHLEGREQARVADIGTGSGCIAVALAVNMPDAEIWATDLSGEALAVAGENAALHSVRDRICFLWGDLLDPLRSSVGLFDVIMSNPPYIVPKEIATLLPEVRDWEPRLALGTDPDPLEVYRRLAADGPALLVHGGFLAVEVGAGQAAVVAELWQEAGLDDVKCIADYSGIERVVCGKK